MSFVPRRGPRRWRSCPSNVPIARAPIHSPQPPRQREVLVLLVYEGFSAAQVADMLGVTQANVHATLHLARKRLKSLLAEQLRLK